MKKTLLALAIALTLIVVYFNIQTNPEVKIFRLFGINFGFSFLTHIGWKVASIAAWITYIMFNEFKNDDN
jgi:hypothetical protein